MLLRRFRASDGTGALTSAPTRTLRERCTRSMADFSMASIFLTRHSSAFPRAKPWPWIRSIGLALEVGWEALENAGHSPATLQGSATGVFLGIANNDYGRAALGRSRPHRRLHRFRQFPGYGRRRLSYVLGLHGPSLAIDTSCSSSLVAVHLACLSLRAGECSVALAGGVNLILSPESNVALSKAHMMARDGHCKTFDEAADGYVRSEGCCIVVLKKLSEAIVGRRSNSGGDPRVRRQSRRTQRRVDGARMAPRRRR